MCHAVGHTTQQDPLLQGLMISLAGEKDKHTDDHMHTRRVLREMEI